MVNFDPLTAEIGWWVWGTPANFNRFRALASLLHRHLSMEVNQTLHGVWLSPGLVHYIYIYILGGSCPLTEFCQVQNSLCGQVSRSPVLTALLHGTGTLCGVVQGMESRNFRSSSFWTEGATYIPRAAITFDIVPHSSLFCFCAANHIIVIYISQNTTSCLKLIITIDWSEIDRPLCTDGSNNKVFFTESKITTYFDL